MTGSSSKILDNSIRDRVSYNRAQINALKVNQLSIQTPNHLSKFANKRYRATAPSGQTYTDYIFNEKSELTVKTKIGTLGDKESVWIRNLKLTPCPSKDRTYISGLTDGEPDTVALRYIMTGLQFNEDYTVIDVSLNVGGPVWITNRNNELAQFLVFGYPPDIQPTIRSIIENELMLFTDPSVKTPFILQN